ncbi:MAG: hypothetical protein V5A88_08905 [Candidatus Thermoplasmatota archaeon]
MHLRRKKEDPATRKLENEGLLSLHSKKKSYINTQKIKEFGQITYDFWSGVKYMVVLSALLWWIPLFGPIIAGYVGGRRTGGPKKGLFASFVSLGVIGIVYYVLVQGLLPVTLDTILSYPAAIISAAEAHSFFGPYFEFIKLYWSTFFARVMAGVPFGTNSYVLTVIFAYIGGIISLEKRKEYTDGIRWSGHENKSSASRVKSAKRSSGSTNRTSPTAKRSLKDLKAISLNRNRQDKGSKNTRKAKKKLKKQRSDQKGGREEKTKRGFQDKKTMKKASVEHHSRSNGDDWELL